jgi:hypothetical protein
MTEQTESVLSRVLNECDKNKDNDAVKAGEKSTPLPLYQKICILPFKILVGVIVAVIVLAVVIVMGVVLAILVLIEIVKGDHKDILSQPDVPCDCVCTIAEVVNALSQLKSINAHLRDCKKHCSADTEVETAIV